LINAFKITHEQTPREYRMQNKEYSQHSNESFSATSTTEFEIASEQLKEHLVDEQQKQIHHMIH
jgi:hypothetical protein